MADPAVQTTGVILAGGLGTRLKSVLPNRPKVLADVKGRPFLMFLLDQLADAGVRRFVVCTGYLGDQVREALGTSYRDLPIRYSQETAPLGTGGALRQAFTENTSDLWLAVNGDSYVGMDLGAFLAWHNERTHPGSLLLTWVEDCARFGTVEVGADGLICGFYEKRGVPKPGWISAGVYLLSRPLLEALPAAVPLSIEREVFPAWLERGLGAYQVRAPFIDIGTPESLQLAEEFFASAAPGPSPSAV